MTAQCPRCSSVEVLISKYCITCTAEIEIQEEELRSQFHRTELNIKLIRRIMAILLIGVSGSYLMSLWDNALFQTFVLLAMGITMWIAMVTTERAVDKSMEEYDQNFKSDIDK
jgi:hypothetical protein